MADSEWVSPRKMMDYFMDDSGGVEATRKKLYLAVIKGEVRARSKGRVLGPQWLRQLEVMTFDDADPFALTPDLELSVEDARALWPR
jgi:hypothetical protein